VKKSSATEAGLQAIHEIRQAPEKYDLKRELASFFRHRSNYVIAAAADTAAKLEVTGLTPEMSEAFLELMRDPYKLDPGCKALIAIAKALAASDAPAPQVYFAGIRHVQKEASFGPPVDVAAQLRGICAQGLARMIHSDTALECVRLLVDPEVAARSGAIRALGETGKQEAMLLLRFKALAGDADGEVVGECFAALLRLDPKHSIEFVAEFLGASDEEVAERAALALGESRLSAVFPLLRAALDETARPSMRRALLFAIAMLRLDEAIAFLLARVAEEPERSAADSLAALASYGRDEALRTRIQETVARRKSPALQAVFDREFH
jgi:HEAT repeat protein